MNSTIVILLWHLVVLKLIGAVVAKPIVFCTVGVSTCPEDQYCEPGFGYCTPCSFICEGAGSSEGACRQACYWRFPDLANSTNGIDFSMNHTGSVQSIEDAYSNQNKQLHSDTEQDNTGLWVFILVGCVCIASLLVLGLIVLFKRRNISVWIKSKKIKGEQYQKAPTMKKDEPMSQNDETNAESSY